MAAWLMDNIWWFVAGLATLFVGIKVALVLAFRRLAQSSEEQSG